MEKNTIYTKDTAQIEKTFNILSCINIVANVLIEFAALIATIVIAVDDEILWLIPAGVLVVSVFALILIQLLLNVQFGMYYDIRKLRMNSENGSSCATVDVDDIPEL